MENDFMGVLLPPGWQVLSDTHTGNFHLATDGSVFFNRSAMEINHAIAKYWNMQREEKLNEQHRQANQAIRNSSLAQRSAGNAWGTTQSLGAILAQQAIPGPFGASTLGGIGGSSASILMQPWQSALAQQMMHQPSPAAPLPRARPIVGELIGHRAWKVEGGNLLRSYSAGTAWFPSQPMHLTVGNKGIEIDDHNTAGVWAFKDPYELAHQFYGEIEGSGVFGTVWLWGTVIEHERGYRGQYAAIRSLDRAGRGVDLEILRAAYLSSPKQIAA